MEVIPETRQLEDQIKQGDPTAEEPALPLIETGLSQSEEVTNRQGASPGDREEPAMSVSEEAEAPSSLITRQELELSRVQGPAIWGKG